MLNVESCVSYFCSLLSLFLPPCSRDLAHELSTCVNVHHCAWLALLEKGFQHIKKMTCLYLPLWSSWGKKDSFFNWESPLVTSCKEDLTVLAKVLRFTVSVHTLIVKEQTPVNWTEPRLEKPEVTRMQLFPCWVTLRCCFCLSCWHINL